VLDRALLEIVRGPADVGGNAKSSRVIHAEAYVTTALGVQVFDKEGKLLGILAKPMPNAALVSVGFAGKEMDTLYIACGDKIYKRKASVKGATTAVAEAEAVKSGIGLATLK